MRTTERRVEGLTGIPIARTPAPGTPSSVRHTNLALVASLALASADPTSRAEIATKTGITGPTVSRLVRELISLGILAEEPAERDGSMGRPSTPVLPASRTIVGVGLEINVGHIAGCAIDLSGAIVGHFKVEFDGNQKEPAAVLQRLRKEADALIADLHASGVSEVCGVCLAVPGVVDHDPGSIVYASNLGWHDIVPGDVLADVLPSRELFSIENDANLQAIAATAALREPDGTPLSFVYVYGEIGTGGAVVRNGVLERGVRGWAGEIGHMTVSPDGVLCRCGANGCLETYSGRQNLMRAAGLRPEATTTDLVAALESGAREAVAAVERAGWALGIALSNALNLLDLRDVVLGTDLGRLLPWLAPTIRYELDRRLLGRTSADVRIHAMPIVEDASSVGGAVKCLQSRLDPSRIAR